jgi:hypothetical protein
LPAEEKEGRKKDIRGVLQGDCKKVLLEKVFPHCQAIAEFS